MGLVREWLSILWAGILHAPVLRAAVLTLIGAAALGAFSWYLKRRLCHKDEFMKRRKRVIDEFGSVTLGILLFCLVTAVQFGLASEMVKDKGSDWVVSKEKAAFWGRLVFLSVGAVGLFVTATAFRTPLAKIDQRLHLEKLEKSVPPELARPFPKTRKALLLGVLFVALVAYCFAIVLTLARSIHVLNALSIS